MNGENSDYRRGDIVGDEYRADWSAVERSKPESIESLWAARKTVATRLPNLRARQLRQRAANTKAARRAKNKKARKHNQMKARRK